MLIDKTKLQGLALLGSRLLIAFIFFWHGFPKAVNPSMAMKKFIGFGLLGDSRSRQVAELVLALRE